MIPDYYKAIKLIKFVAADAVFCLFRIEIKDESDFSVKKTLVVLFRYLHKVIKSKPIIAKVARHIKQ
jgi:hypothetical protein